MQKQQQPIKYYPKKQLLTCRLCTDIFKKPVTLTCGHTFCYNCLYKFMKQHNGSRLSQEKQNVNLQKAEESRNNTLSFDVSFGKVGESDNNNDDMQQDSPQTDTIPLPLCPTCSGLIFKPIKNLKENLTLTNLITHANLKPEIKFQSLIYDQQVQNFDHKILVKIDPPKIQPLPFAHSEIRFSTCFLDDMLEQSHSSYIVVQWPGFKKNIGLAGKIQRIEIEYHSSSHRSKENHYRGFFSGMFFVKIQKRKSMEINLKSRYYTQATLYSQEHQQLAPLTICKCLPYHSTNIQPLTSFQPFLYFYDKLNNHHYLNQIYRLIDPSPLFQRNNPETMIYSCIRILKLKPEERKQVVESFDDEIRIRKINEFLQRMEHLPVEDFIHVSVPGKYNSAFVFAVIVLLIVLHYFQTN